MPVLFCPRESSPGETRVALTPDSASRLALAGVTCVIEASAGSAAGFPDSEYTAAGATIAPEASAVVRAADIVISVKALPDPLIDLLKPGALVISFLDPFREPSTTARLASTGARALSLEFIPRTTIAQKMDALSSQASLAGYASVLLASMCLDKILPMMMTPAGTLQPSRFLIVGVGVAGLQAIATAKRLGARVTAFDTRPVVEEQVRSLGAKFLKIDLGETGQTDQGYARELTTEQIELQRRGMAKACAESDAVITTAQVFGRPAPRIITAPMLDGMRPGSVVVDMAVATGGNVEGSEPGREVVRNGVRILGADNLPCSVPRDASTVLANNIMNLVTHLLGEDGSLATDPSDEIAASALVCAGGSIVNERVKSILEQPAAAPTN